MPCCCLAQSDCVLVISIYGVSVSVALLSVLGLHGHDFGPGFSPITTEILHKTALSVYGICLLANILLFVGNLLTKHRKLFLIPWLVCHTLLVVALMAASLYYLGKIVTNDKQFNKNAFFSALYFPVLCWGLYSFVGLQYSNNWCYRYPPLLHLRCSRLLWYSSS